MALKTVRNFVCLFNSFRKYSTSGPFVDVAVNEKTGIAVATLQRPPVKALNLEILTDLNNTFQQMEKNKSRGLILTSSSKSVFSAGLDIYEMYKPNMDRCKQFWTTLQQTWMNLYGSSYPTVAVVNGHAIAGGCMLALSCEYRIMLNNFTIGFNEAKLGIVAPSWLMASMKNAVGNRQSELLLITGRLFKTEEALQIGLVDEVAQNKDEAMQKAEIFLEKFANIPHFARSLTKKSLRGDDIKKFMESKDKELENMVTFLNAAQVQKTMGLYLESLKQKKK